MPTIKDKLTADPGFQYVVDSLNIMSSPARHYMLRQPLCSDHETLRREYSHIALVIALLHEERRSPEVSVILHQFMQLHDLQGTLLNLQHRLVLEEIELFEIKKFAHLCLETAKAAATCGIGEILRIPDLGEVFSLLDPDCTRVVSFYVYDSYHPGLGPLRRQLKAKQTLMDGGSVTGDAQVALQLEINDLFDQQNQLQQEVIAQLSERLVSFQSLLSDAMERMCYSDLLFAKAALADEWHCCEPQLVDAATPTRFRQLFNARLKKHNADAGLRYQPVDLELRAGACLITGANMAGKTVLLKTVGIAQLMAQFALFVPAEEAVMQTVDDVVFCIGDEQNEMNGLSSYASEIIKISDTLKRSARERLLILIDEPARTTNPVEGKAIVQAVASILDGRPSLTLITTHYSQLGLSCRRLRVRGFVESMADVPLTPQNINRFMDYSLLPDESDNVPQEALRIASILGCDDQMLSLANDFLKK